MKKFNLQIMEGERRNTGKNLQIKTENTEKKKKKKKTFILTNML